MDELKQEPKAEIQETLTADELDSLAGLLAEASVKVKEAQAAMALLGKLVRMSQQAKVKNG